MLISRFQIFISFSQKKSDQLTVKCGHRSIWQLLHVAFSRLNFKSYKCVENISNQVMKDHQNIDFTLLSLVVVTYTIGNVLPFTGIKKIEKFYGKIFVLILELP